MFTSISRYRGQAAVSSAKEGVRGTQREKKAWYIKTHVMWIKRKVVRF